MRTATPVLRFGPFELDPGDRRLRRGADVIALPPRYLDVLLLLASRPGEVVTKESLTEEAWQGLAVTDNSIVQAIRGVRQALGERPEGGPYVETLTRRGYRFAARVDRTQPRRASAPLDDLLAPHHAFVTGRAALERLTVEGVGRARAAFQEALDIVPHDAAAHIGLANACVSCGRMESLSRTCHRVRSGPGDLAATHSRQPRLVSLRQTPPSVRTPPGRRGTDILST